MKQTTLILGGEKWTYKRSPKVYFKGELVDATYDFATHTIDVTKRLKGFAEMESDIHEIDHVMHDEHEKKVTRKSREKTRALRKLGYRKLTPEQIKILGIK